MKLFPVILLALVAFALGACASKQQQTYAPTQAPVSYGYSK